MLVNYQPIVSLRTRRVVRAEALCRFPQSPPGLDAPRGFIPHAEKQGLINGLTSWLFETTCAFWRELGPTAPELALNLSVHNLLEVDLADRLRACLRKNRLEAGRLWLEFDERVIDLHDAASHDMLGQLKALGVRLSIDGFGPTLSSVSHLQIAALPISELKIHPGMVADIDRDPALRARLRAVGEIAAHLHLDLAAKGIERAETADWLARHGFVRAQGFAFGPPVEAEAFAKMFRRPVLASA
jgi:EAL domain-containing protein (putative c-di-GMP-specific phosphodiesterase class I)